MPNNNHHNFKTTRNNQKSPTPSEAPQTPINNESKDILTPKPAYPSDKRPNYHAPQPAEAPVKNTAGKKTTLTANKQPSKSHKPWYKKPLFWIITVIVIIITLIGSFLIFQSRQDSESNPPAPKPDLTSNTLKKKKPNQENIKKASKASVSRSVNKSTNKNNSENQRNFKNPGSYSDMKYETDDFKIEIDNSSDGVKLISDTNSQPALYIRYTFTNNSKSDLKPADIVNQDIQLKQNEQILNTDGNINDDSTDDKNRLDTAQQPVTPGQSAQVAMMYQVNNTKDQISMFFMNLKTKQPLSTTQPFKL
ncbi:DUF5067 domain-containing protein [Bombilactobacillus thymidiniphilus]|uniref:DUF5067 domain-containing protein n=1 Tax=Bombilactobacillus thymidiniphilus TaxID=2923363 RepID=A0ABY4PF73_9LACO|nr:DUF5067 domain-containing protein [Bombilactobacillus thymidiniphilus]UQS83967.1 DUF5067 domain-containing protein [Bombilactobacillus thymidiniphilus]